jgi:hypothetical protein
MSNKHCLPHSYCVLAQIRPQNRHCRLISTVWIEFRRTAVHPCGCVRACTGHELVCRQPRMDPRGIVLVWQMGQHHGVAGHLLVPDRTVPHHGQVRTRFLCQSQLRNSAGGLMGVLASGGGVLAPIVASLVGCWLLVSAPCQNEVNNNYPPIIFCATCIASAVCTLCLPETMHHELPEDMADIRQGPFLHACNAAWRRCTGRPPVTAIKSRDPTVMDDH